MEKEHVVTGGGLSFGTGGGLNHRRWGGRKSPAMTLRITNKLLIRSAIECDGFGSVSEPL